MCRVKLNAALLGTEHDRTWTGVNVGFWPFSTMLYFLKKLIKRGKRRYT